MVYVGNIREVKEGQFDHTFVIMRSYKGKQKWIKQMSELAPSWDLFMESRSMMEKGKWNKDTFQTFYVPRFLQQMREPLGKESLNFIQRLSKSQNIALVCFCTNEETCHRSIIAGLLQGMGVNVTLISGKDYSKYYQTYKEK